MPEIVVSYDHERVSAVISAAGDLPITVWNRVEQACIQADPELEHSPKKLVMAWAAALPVLLEVGAMRRAHKFSMRAEGEALQRLARFKEERRLVYEASKSTDDTLSLDDIQARLVERGFANRSLKPFQLRDLSVLLSLRHGANFSVPGAGKTTVTLALHVLATDHPTSLLVVAPKNAFGAWDEVISDCMKRDAPQHGAERFTRLDGQESEMSRLLHSSRKRFIMSYERFVKVEQLIKTFLMRRPTHIVLDEAHRIKAGEMSQRGRSILSVAPLPVRKDILTGTPAPHSLGDLSPQFDFLWPGTLIGNKIVLSSTPRKVIENLYVRTTKHELGLPPVRREFVHVEMSDAQLSLYSVMRSEAVAQLSGIRGNSGVDLIRARRCVMRLLQASTNPAAAALAMSNDDSGDTEAIGNLLELIASEGDSPKLMEVSRLVRESTDRGEKVVVWTIFRDTIHRLENILHDLSPVALHGGVPVGSVDDDTTREGRLRKFHEDDACKVVIANPAACSEGISLHKVCHHAIYADRSYNAAHYLQSIDRIHRLGLPDDTETRITIVQSIAPQRVGSIDHSVSRRLLSKMQMMEGVLDDEDIRQLALDEELAEPPVDRDITFDDLADILEQLLNPSVPEEDEQV